MSSWLIAAVGVVYVIVAVDLIRQGNTPLGMTFLGYAFSNVGLYFASGTLHTP